MAKHKPAHSRGHKLLAKAVRGMVQAEAARGAGLDTVELNKILRGHRGASLRQAVALRDTFGVPVESWLESAA